jgi:uncharacterized membrane protein
MDREARRRIFERRIGRLLIALTYASVVLLLIGVVLMLAAGISPLSSGPPLDPRTLVSGLVALEPDAFLWLGLLAVLATPVSRVVAAAIGFARTGEWMLVAAAVGILATIVLSIASVVVFAGPSTDAG